MSRKNRTLNLWVVLTLVVVLSVGLLASMGVKNAAAQATAFAVEYPFNWPATGPGFKVNVTVYDADYMYSWQVYMTFDPAVLSFTGVTFGGFLATQPEGSSTNVAPGAGYVFFSEATIGQYQGKSAAEGLLVTVTFTVLSSGHTTIDISGGTSKLTRYVYCFQFPQLVTKYPATQNGYMCTLKGDTDFDGDVDYTDFLAFCAEYLKTSGSVGWTGKADFDHDGDVDYTDFLAFTSNYLKTV